MGSSDLKQASEEQLWEQLRAIVVELDERSDRNLISNGELDEDDVPSGQSLGSMVIAYSMTYIEDGQLRSMVTNMIPPGTLDETAVGILRIAERQCQRVFFGDDD